MTRCRRDEMRLQWKPSNRRLSFDERRILTRLIHEEGLRKLQERYPVQTRNAPVLADEEMGAGISSLSLSLQP